MSVYQSKNSPYWQFDFWVKGHRYFGTLEDENGQPIQKTERRKRAEDREAVLKSEARQQRARGRQRERLSLENALALYYEQHGQHLPSAEQILSYSANWQRIGPMRKPQSLLTKMLDEVSDADIAWYVSQRRGEFSANHNPKLLPDGTTVPPPLVSLRTVNADVEFLRAVFRRAAQSWGAEVGDELNWSAHLLELPPPPTRVLSADEDEALFKAIDKLRPDFRDMIDFAMLSGWRLSEVIGLQKAKVSRQAMTASVVVKGGAEVSRPLNGAMLAIIERNWARHFTHVFTYELRKQRGQRRKGDRVPFTRNGWRKEWKRFIREAGIAPLRFHDLRHTLGTRVYLATRDPRAVQKVLAHRDPATSERYIHTVGEIERAALDAAAALRIPDKSRIGVADKKEK